MRLALFGGTFDPIHCAHLTVAHEAMDKFELDQVWFLPAANPPHKTDQDGAGYEDRCRMVELAIYREPRWLLSRLEGGPATSYSIDTIEKVRASGEEPSFIIGADAFSEITTWHRWQDLVRVTEFIVVTRPGHEYLTPLGAHVHRLDTVALPVSSSEIRRRLGAGEIPSELPPEVARFIAERHLYQYSAAPVRSVSHPS